MVDYYPSNEIFHSRYNEGIPSRNHESEWQLTVRHSWYMLSHIVSVFKYWNIFFVFITFNFQVCWIGFHELI